MNRITNRFQDISLAAFGMRFWQVWTSYFWVLFLCLAIMGILFVGRVWYENLYTLSALGPEKAAKISERTAQVQLDRDAFDALRVWVDERDQAARTSVVSSRDPFYPSFEIGKVTRSTAADDVVDVDSAQDAQILEGGVRDQGVDVDASRDVTTASDQEPPVSEESEKRGENENRDTADNDAIFQGDDIGVVEDVVAPPADL